jgi:diaminopimelate decarboxylase
MSKEFEERLFPRLPRIIEYFSTPFHIFDEKGMLENPGFREFYAVKALPNPTILKIMKELDFGLDCSSPSELILARQNGFKPMDIMFSSNNTSDILLKQAGEEGGCILNLDDISLIDRVAVFPELISFRYNPGERRTGNQLIGIPVEAKYGVRHDQLIPAYRHAMERGAKRFGIHTMI